MEEKKRILIVLYILMVLFGLFGIYTFIFKSTPTDDI